METSIFSSGARGRPRGLGGRAALLGAAALLSASAASAQVPTGPSTQFDITGFIEEATLDPSCVADPHCGGTLKLNGHTVTVPKNTIVIFPANALSWQETFTKAPAPYAPLNMTGMALADFPAPMTTYEVQVVGNRVIDPVAGADRYIAGLVYISQQGLNQGAGFINFIDYTLGEIRVGGALHIDGAGKALNELDAVNPGARVRINDPVGRYGRATTSPDVRFTADPDNPTIMAGTGYPMCLPRSAPNANGTSTDALCPEENRPLDALGNHVPSFTTNNLTNPGFPQFPGVFPDSTQQAPLEVGDYVTYAGMLVHDDPTPLTGPWPALGVAGTYIAAHSIVSNVAIYTFPGSNPAYIETDVFILGTGGLTVLGAGEAAIRTRFEGMMTDPSRTVHLYGIDLDAAGNATDRDWGTIGVDPGPPLGAVKGRWRFRPPCAPFGTDPATIKFDKQCINNAVGTFLPAPREMRAVIEGLQGQVPGLPSAQTASNGIFWGQYHAPILEYIFPENIPGTPIVENNFNTMPFLACGGYSSTGIGIPPTAPTLAGQLSPWPSNVVPDVTTCVGFVAAPAVTAAANPASVISGTGATITLSASATGTAPLTFLWTQAATDPIQVALTGASTSAATFAAPVVAANTTLNFTVTVSNSVGSATASVPVAIVVDQPIVNAVASQTVPSGVPVTMNITGTDPGGLALTFTVTQTGGPVPNIAPLTVTQVPPTGARATFTLSLAQGAPAATLTFAITATNSAGASSAPVTTSVTVDPLADSVVVTSAEYRMGKQRLVINATSSVVNASVVLKLGTYLGVDGQQHDLCPSLGCTFTNNGGGLYIIDVVGAPRPACKGTAVDLTNYATPCTVPIQVNSSLGGFGTSPLTKIRL